jgi:hypothetical protein
MSRPTRHEHVTRSIWPALGVLMTDPTVAYDDWIDAAFAMVDTAARLSVDVQDVAAFVERRGHLPS